ncbi:MAG: asparagine synthase (glutamine-hydrolyzing), partial [Sphingomonadales bacterium]
MCGINGVLAIDPISNLKGIISRMNEVIIHRGPDDSGTFIDSNQMIALGMRRLAIIDLESGHQPMLSDDGSIIVVFNGEIYNYKKLRAELSENHGVTFSTGSDTEVILKGYQLLGTAYFSNLNGMFAFAIYDVKLSRVFLVRDRTGEKPLYFWTNSRYFVFASEIKSLKAFMSLNHLKQPAISKTAMNLFFSLTYIPAPYSIFEGISKLEPGHFLEVNTTDLSVLKKSYWSFSTFLDQDRISDYSLAKRELQRLLYESVESRMISDVPYGAFLSGGVDSSIVTAVMSDISRDQKIKTFSIISQNSKFDESARSNAVSKHCNTEHYPISLDLKSIEEDIEKVILNFDEPFADSSALPTYYVSKVTSNYVKVALTGDGGDEVFGGYNRYLMPYYSKLYKNLIPSWLHDFILKPAFSSISLKTDSRGSVYRLKKFIDAIGRSEYD